MKLLKSLFLILFIFTLALTMYNICIDNYDRTKIETVSNPEKNEEEKTYKVQKSTIIENSDINKVENVKIAINTINNFCLKSGEEFSFKNIIGNTTKERGYKEATVIYLDKNGNPYKGLGLGGGICQVSSTIYMACKELNLEIIERRPHSARVDYCSIEDEAMVNDETSDFRFRNSLNENITIKLYLAPIQGNAAQQKVVCEIW